jgi:hypothetical protein
MSDATVRGAAAGAAVAGLILMPRFSAMITARVRMLRTKNDGLIFFSRSPRLFRGALKCWRLRRLSGKCAERRSPLHALSHEAGRQVSPFRMDFIPLALK